MKFYGLTYKDINQKTTINHEFWTKKELINKINECAEKGFLIIDVFEKNLYREI
ncbi:hypothetical protein [Clostridium sp. JS66]|uniref:hypothetical protein n=1 Tax=Clostridium sp. JS66 TaxID=3064705 RepID=UPI00298DDB56|nr:hypothetical protein [Clostridium sp. JS66]WPC39642.1 hypothetical protein Q6H37_17170 [Clostridium sp. JS66]